MLDDLANVPTNMAAHARGFAALFQRYAAFGKNGLTSEQFHEAGGDDIYRFRKGRLRVYCFLDETNLVILSHAAVKKKQKTPPSDLTKAEAVKKEYMAAKIAGALSITEAKKS
ncbi:MAG: type II toxin-antitoxin system RelE/ParE family toxin [Porticoccaceae bacterium]|nr:type II toxin-antitoxin system RelE/ParE family toxin [Porticoccaceae bacterium]